MKKITSFIMAITLALTLIPTISLAAVTDQELADYVREAGRTEQELIEYLALFEMSLEDFKNIAELKDFIGTPLTSANLESLLAEYDLTMEELQTLLEDNRDIEEGQDILEAFFSYDDLRETILWDIDNPLTPITEDSLNQLLDDYGMTKAELEQLLAENDDSLENYKFIEHLEEALYAYSGDYEEDFAQYFDQLGITEEEMERLNDHFESLDMEDPAFLQRMEDLAARMENIGDFENPEDLSPAQLLELAKMMDEFLDLFQLKAKFYLEKDGEKTPVGWETLFQMEDPQGYNLFVEFYNKNGVLLIDMLVTPELFGSEVIEETGEDLEQVKEQIEQPAPAPKAPVVKVSKKGSDVQQQTGHRLPDTATSNPALLALGAVLAGAGILLFRRNRV